jgi:hypothetical protein
MLGTRFRNTDERGDSENDLDELATVRSQDNLTGAAVTSRPAIEDISFRWVFFINDHAKLRRNRRSPTANK